MRKEKLFIDYLLLNSAYEVVRYAWKNYRHRIGGSLAEKTIQERTLLCSGRV